MAGNKKYGFLRGNKGGFKPERWMCHGCGKFHEANRSKNGTLDGRTLCDKEYFNDPSVITPDFKAYLIDALKSGNIIRSADEIHHINYLQQATA